MNPAPIAAQDGAPLAAHDGAPFVLVRDGVARLTLSRPAEHNRLDPADIDALQPLLESLAADPGVRALVVTGTGEKTFSSGYTLDAILSELDARLERLLDTIEALPFPTIAAFNGSVYGGATDLALACDFRIGIPGMRMFMPAARFALHYYPGGMRRYVTRLGLNAAKKLFLTAMTVEADELLRIGFLTEVVERERLAARVDEYLAAIAQTDREVVARMKKHLNQIAEGRFDELALRAANRESLGSDELRARLQALRGSRR
jgi:enoyl-CoA hydratase/carnithine racemase